MTPAAKQLLGVDDKKLLLEQKLKDTLHSVTSNCLYITKRESPNIESTVDLLCTRVSKRNEYYWKKLERLLVFLNNAIYDKSYIRLFYIESLYTWIDVAYAAHPDLKIHTGGGNIVRTRHDALSVRKKIYKYQNLDMGENSEGN